MRTYWDGRARTNALWYVDTSLDFHEPDLTRFLETGRAIVADALDRAPVPIPDGGTAVEIGCGLGRVCLALAERYERVVGIDIAPEMLQRARAFVGNPRVSFVLGDGRSLSAIGDASADVVLSFTVFQHIPDPAVTEAYLIDAARVLRPGGVLVFQWNNEPRPWRWAIRRWVLSALQRSGLRPERYGRHAPAFLGARIPTARVQRALHEGGLRLAGSRNEGTLYAWAWATKPPSTAPGGPDVEGRVPASPDHG
jgi:SAM-dependent methyltransferase